MHAQRPHSQELSPSAYAELYRLAAMLVAKESGVRSFGPSDICSEAYLRLRGTSCVPIERFRARAANVIRRILVDAARRRNAEKRGRGWERTSIESATREVARPDFSLDLVDLDAELEALGGVDPRAARVIELRHFGGLTSDEIAAELGVSVRTVTDDLKRGAQWLKERLRDNS